MIGRQTRHKRSLYPCTWLCGVIEYSVRIWFCTHFRHRWIMVWCHRPKNEVCAHFVCRWITMFLSSGLTSCCRLWDEMNQTFPSIFTCYKQSKTGHQFEWPWNKALLEVLCMWPGATTHREVEIGSISRHCHLHFYQLGSPVSIKCPTAIKFSLEFDCTITGGDQQFYDNRVLTLADLKWGHRPIEGSVL